MSDRWTVTKKWEFPAGHRLFGYNGHCLNIHGHSFVAEVCLSTEYLNHLGLAYDFTDLRQVKDWIDNYWDHAFLVSSDDKEMLEFLSKTGSKYYVICQNPSTENIAKELYRVIRSDCMIPTNVEIEWVDIWESSKCSARYTKELALKEGIIQGFQNG